MDSRKSETTAPKTEERKKNSTPYKMKKILKEHLDPSFVDYDPKIDPSFDHLPNIKSFLE